MGNNDIILYIYAGTEQQARDFAKEKGIPREKWRYLYVHSQLRGVREMPYIRHGTWQDNPNRQYIDRMLIERDMIEIIYIRV